jgi:hypothetical protein
LGHFGPFWSGIGAGSFDEKKARIGQRAAKRHRKWRRKRQEQAKKRKKGKGQGYERRQKGKSQEPKNIKTQKP